MDRSVPEVDDLCLALVKGARESMMAADESGMIVFENDAATRFSAGPDREGMPRSIYELLHPDDGVAMRVAIDRSRDPRESAAFVDCHVRHRDGRWIPVEAMVRTIDGRGGSRHVLLYFRDGSESLAMEARLRQAHRLASLGRLTTGVADDVGRVMATIRSQLERLPLSDAEPFALRIIRRAAETGSALVQQIRSFTESAPASRHGIDVHALLHALRDSLSPDVWIDMQLDATAATVRVDHDGLRRGLHDLVLGFVHGMPDGSVVRITTRNLPSSRHLAGTDASTAVLYLVVEISNTAQGPPTSSARRLFEPRAELPVSTPIMLALVILDDVSINASGFVEVSANANGATVVTTHLVVE